MEDLNRERVRRAIDEPPNLDALREIEACAAENDLTFVSVETTQFRALLSSAEAREEAEREKAEAQSHRALYAKRLHRLNDVLQGVLDDLEDEGDRVYFGSSNDADRLKRIAQSIEDLHWDDLLAHTQPKVNLYDAIEARMAEARLAEFLFALALAALQSAEARAQEAEQERDAWKADSADTFIKLQSAETRAQQAEARVEELEKALREIADRYEDVDLSHRDFRVEAVRSATQALDLANLLSQSALQQGEER